MNRTIRMAALMAMATILAGASACTRCTTSPSPTPPPVPESGQRVFLERGLMEGTQGQKGEFYYIETPSGARIPTSEPGSRFIVAVGADGVTMVQVRQGQVWVWANGDWVNVGAGEQTRIWPGSPPEEPTGVDAYLDRVTYLAAPMLGQ